MNSLDIKSYAFPSIVEKREQGVLRVFESDNIPFIVKRVFSVVNAKGGSKRGQHAHKKCNQLICCVAGEVNLICDDGNTPIEILLSSENEAVLVPCGIWAEQDYLKDNSVIMVFCDQPYDEKDYIRDYNEYLIWINNKK
jgi:dTDP-4-dehydrorhamnose 3,5-epimerase-like enzyme